MEATLDHCRYCFEALQCHLTQKELPEPWFDCDFKAGIFVTWKIQSGGGYDLRGCIGNLSQINFWPGLQDYAITSAIRDHRFPPITLEELPLLQCGVSLLLNFEEGKKAMEWEVGKHGIWINFTSGGKNYSATYLPEVIPEQDWTQIEALHSLVRKSGYRGPVTDELLDSISLTTYESSKAALSYDDWQTLRAAATSK